jgi:TonB family protein
VVAGRRDDGELLMDLINRGQVYRFLLKPVSPGRARLAIEASIKRHLEAADSAFRTKPRNDTAAPKDDRKPAKSGTVARIVPKLSAAPRSDEPATRPAPTVDDMAGNAASPRSDTSSDDSGEDRLDRAFGDSGRFTRTMTGIVTTVGKTFGGAAGTDETAADGDSASNGRPPSVFQPRLLAIGGAALVAIAATVWWLGFADTPQPRQPDSARSIPQETPPDDTSPSVVETEVPQSAGQPAQEVEAPPPAYKQFLDEARIARDRGEVVVPPGSNAIELYVAARNIAPEVPVIATELAQVITTAIALVESALLDQRTADAAQTLRLVRLADPNNPRLPFLEGQVAQLQLRANLDQARASIRERRFEDAATALRNAQNAGGGETPEIALLVEELASARSEQRVDEVLTLASQRVEQNALTSPANDSARYYYELALSNDPQNTVARQGLTIVASKLVLGAREAIDVGRLDDAERYLRDATALDPQGADLGASMQALNSARAEREAAALAETERLAELEREEALAQAALDASVSADGDVLGQDTGSGDGLAANSAGQPANRNGSSASSDQGFAATASTGYVPISSLKRTNYVAPRYPRSAQRRNITGWVDVTFTVNRGGNVVDVGILDSNPGDVFNEAAREAVSQWRFEPSLENGTLVEKLVAVRLMFNLE